MGNLIRREAPSSSDNDEIAEQSETSLTRTILTASVFQLQQRISLYHRHYRHHRYQAGGGESLGTIHSCIQLAKIAINLILYK